MREERGRLLWTVTDPWRREVRMFSLRSTHTLEERHRDIRERDIKLAIERADRRTRGNRPDDEELWAFAIRRRLWLKVVVAYEGNSGWVRTAHLSRKGPRQDRLI